RSLWGMRAVRKPYRFQPTGCFSPSDHLHGVCRRGAGQLECSNVEPKTSQGQAAEMRIPHAVRRGTGGSMLVRDAVALVPGGSSGIGRQVAARLAADGAHVLVGGRDATRTRDAALAVGGTPLIGDIS